MKRTGNLKHDEAKLRAWEQRSRATARERARQAPPRAPLRRSAPKKRATLPRAARRVVERRSAGRCVVCGRSRREAARAGDGMHRHHVLPVRQFPELELEPDNLVLTCDPCHDRHERALPRIRREQLPACSLALAERVGSAAAAYVERTYPAVAGPSRAEPGDAKGA